MSFLSGNLTSILLKTKKSSDSLSQQNAKENNSQTAFVIEVRLDIKKIIEKPSAAINLQKTTPILLHMDEKKWFHLMCVSLLQQFQNWKWFVVLCCSKR